jgi:hypothetical protein
MLCMQSFCTLGGEDRLRHGCVRGRVMAARARRPDFPVLYVLRFRTAKFVNGQAGAGRQFGRAVHTDAAPPMLIGLPARLHKNGPAHAARHRYPPAPTRTLSAHAPAMAVMTMHPALAVPELLDQILHVDRPTLKRCALVSRTWRDTVRPALFARVVIATDAHLHELLAAAAARAALCARVRTLTVGPGTALSAGALARAALGLHAFAALSGLRELVWVGVDWAPLAGAPGLRAAFARVEVLRLERALQSSGALLDFVGAFPALRELRLGALLTIDVRFSGPRLDMGAPGRRARLEAFELKGHAQLHPQFWRGLLDTFDFTGLHELKTDCYMPAAIQGLTKIAERAAESLRTLTLVADFNHPVECLYFSIRCSVVLELTLLRQMSAESMAPSSPPPQTSIFSEYLHTSTSPAPFLGWHTPCCPSGRTL